MVFLVFYTETVLLLNYMTFGILHKVSPVSRDEICFISLSLSFHRVTQNKFKVYKSEGKFNKKDDPDTNNNKKINIQIKQNKITTKR